VRIEQAIDIALQSGKARRIGPSIEPDAFALAIDQHELLRVKSLLDRQHVHLRADAADVIELAGQEQPLLRVGVESLRVLGQYLRAIGFGIAGNAEQAQGTPAVFFLQLANLAILIDADRRALAEEESYDVGLAPQVIAADHLAGALDQ